MIANLKGIVMNDFIKDTEFEGVKKSTRVLYLFQKDNSNKELVEIKDIPPDLKIELNKELLLPCEIRHWRNPKGQSGLSIKYLK